jgi:hypothetical protein
MIVSGRNLVFVRGFAVLVKLLRRILAKLFSHINDNHTKMDQHQSDHDMFFLVNIDQSFQSSNAKMP